MPIKGNNTFAEIFRRSKKITAKNCYCYVVFAPVAEDTTFKYAAIVRKKVVHKATCRNRVKRLLRVSIRQNIAYSADKDFFRHIKHFVVYWNAPLVHPKLLRLAEVSAGITELFAKADEFYRMRYEKRDKTKSAGE